MKRKLSKNRIASMRKMVAGVLAGVLCLAMVPAGVKANTISGEMELTKTTKIGTKIATKDNTYRPTQKLYPASVTCVSGANNYCHITVSLRNIDTAKVATEAGSLIMSGYTVSMNYSTSDGGVKGQRYLIMAVIDTRSTWSSCTFKYTMTP